MSYSGFLPTAFITQPRTPFRYSAREAWTPFFSPVMAGETSLVDHAKRTSLRGFGVVTWINETVQRGSILMKDDRAASVSFFFNKLSAAFRTAGGFTVSVGDVVDVEYEPSSNGKNYAVTVNRVGKATAMVWACPACNYSQNAAYLRACNLCGASRAHAFAGANPPAIRRALFDGHAQPWGWGAGPEHFDPASTPLRGPELQPDLVDKAWWRACSARCNSPKSTWMSVVNFNILADRFCMTQQHSYVRPTALRLWSSRRLLLYRFLELSRASLVCLQEVQTKHFADLRDHMAALGYGCHHSSKIWSDGFCPLRDSGIGNCLFFRLDTFKSCELKVVPFAVRLKSLCESNKPDPATLRQHLDRYCGAGQVGLLAHLKHVQTGRSVIAVCTHVSANWKNPDTQLAQVFVLVKETERFVVKVAADDGVQPAVVMAGDFNSDVGSAALQLLTQGRVAAGHPGSSPTRVVGQPQLQQLRQLSHKEASHDLRLVSAYSQKHENTNVTPDFSGCLDHILFGRAGISQSQSMPLPTDYIVRAENGGLPNSWCPSDHLPIAACLQLR